MLLSEYHGRLANYSMLRDSDKVIYDNEPEAHGFRHVYVFTVVLPATLRVLVIAVNGHSQFVNIAYQFRSHCVHQIKLIGSLCVPLALQSCQPGY